MAAFQRGTDDVVDLCLSGPLAKILRAVGTLFAVGEGPHTLLP
jgi:hypothetical protein